MNKIKYDFPEIGHMYYCGSEGLHIFPTPTVAEKIHYKWYAKRRWWQLWKPKWYAITFPVDKGTHAT